MEYNPLNSRFVELENQMHLLQKDEEHCCSWLQWYNAIDAIELSEEIKRLTIKINKCKSDLILIESGILEIKENVDKTDLDNRGIFEKHSDLMNVFYEIQKREIQISEELQWYNSIDAPRLASNLVNCQATKERLEVEIQAAEKEILDNSAKLLEIVSVTGTLFNPLNWFAKDQIGFRRRRAEYQDLINQRTKDKDAKAKELQAILPQLAILENDLQRHKEFDFVRRNNDKEEVKISIASKKHELASLENKIEKNQGTLAQLREIGEQKVAQKKLMEKELEGLEPRLASQSSIIQKHREFDFPGHSDYLSKIRQDIINIKEEMEDVANRKFKIDKLLAPHIERLRNVENQLRSAKYSLGDACLFDRELSKASNRYERKIIHEKCERQFGKGRPNEVIGDLKKDIDKFERQYEKAKIRIEKEAFKASREINTIVVDGNNLCYESGNIFIGLNAIVSLLPHLNDIPEVIIVFDSEICRMLRTDINAIRNHLGCGVIVHVVAPNQKADETVLDLASQNEFTYILSNDRFSDFNEKSVVNDGRIIRHEIVNGNVLVHDLHIKVSY